jgi:hypothetical protein
MKCWTALVSGRASIANPKHATAWMSVWKALAKLTSAECICAANVSRLESRQRCFQRQRATRRQAMAKQNQKRNKPPSDVDQSEEPMLLSKALKIIAAKYPWMPTWSLRQSVVEGKVPAYRSSDKKGARYFVRLSDLIAALPRAEG